MDGSTIVRIMDRFLKKDFGLPEAEALWGPVEIDSNPNALILKHRDPALERVTLGTVEINGRRVLSTIHLKYLQPLRIEMKGLLSAYGAPREQPRLKPNQPIPLLFEVKGRDMSGNLVLGLEQGQGEIRMLRTIRFLRLPPGL